MLYQSLSFSDLTAFQRQFIEKYNGALSLPNF